MATNPHTKIQTKSEAMALQVVITQFKRFLRPKRFPSNKFYKKYLVYIACQ